MNKLPSLSSFFLCALWVPGALFLAPLQAAEKELPANFQMAKLAPSAAWKIRIASTASDVSDGAKKLLVARETKKTPGIRVVNEKFSDMSTSETWYVHFSDREIYRIYPNPQKKNELDVALVQLDENKLLGVDFPELAWLEPANDFQGIKTMNGIDFYVFKCPAQEAVAGTGSPQELSPREAAAGAALLVTVDSCLPVQFTLAGDTWIYEFEAPPAPLVLPQAYRERLEQQMDLGRRVRRQLGFVP